MCNRKLKNECSCKLNGKLQLYFLEPLKYSISTLLSCLCLGAAGFCDLPCRNISVVTPCRTPQKGSWGRAGYWRVIAPSELPFQGEKGKTLGFSARPPCTYAGVASLLLMPNSLATARLRMLMEENTRTP